MYTYYTDKSYVDLWVDYDLYNEMNICPILRSSCVNTGCQFGFQRRKNMLGSKCLDSKEKTNGFRFPAKNDRICGSICVPGRCLWKWPRARAALPVLPALSAPLSPPRLNPVVVVVVVAAAAGGGGGAMSCNVTCNIIEGSLEVKLPTIWTDEKQSRAEAERRGRLEERRSEEKE